MIKIHDRLWFIVKDVEDKDSNLAYMCQYEENKSGGVSSTTENMQRTGRRWVGNSKKSEDDIIDNTPTKGFYVGISVSRWSTSNKLFRVEDPRGFTVEIPTDNLATVLHHTTVIKGVIQEECVWGRDGGNHILLPVNSEPYNLSRKNQNILDNKLIPMSEVKQGDWVKFFGSDKEYYFYGRVKITWKVRGYKPRWYGYGYRNRTDEIEYTDWHDIEDDKYVNLFLREVSYSSGNEWRNETPSKPKITEVVRNSPIEIEIDKLGWMSCPERVRNKMDGLVDTRYFTRTEALAKNIKHKP